MNKQTLDILKYMIDNKYTNQRALAEETGFSLGAVNKSLKTLIEQGYLSEDMKLTALAKKEQKAKAPKNAIILAAGFGMRMVPINTLIPKGLIEVKGELLIERIIKQLHEAGVKDIKVVAGFMKERYEYLIDDYGVDLIINPDYAIKNNIHTLKLVSKYISNTYIIPCDIWCASNPFSKTELYSWYMVSDRQSEESDVRVNRKNELVSEISGGNAMIGISYLAGEEAVTVCRKLEEFCKDRRYDDCFWEETLLDNGKMIVQAKVVPGEDAVEINTYEQLRELDYESEHLKSDAIDAISDALKCDNRDIKDITVLKKGMTNRSFLFTVKGEKYIMRIPGEGTENLINRDEEAEVFEILSGRGICDDPVYIKPDKGYKITKFLEGVRTCDPEDQDDLKKCMKKLKAFHELKLKVSHTFDIFEKIDFYESLMGEKGSDFKDYDKVKANILSLRKFVDEQPKDWCLTHIDAVPDNFLFYKNEGDKQESLQLTDWEYAGMQDPHVDIAMFSIYSYYDKSQIDNLMKLYFGKTPDHSIKAKIYCYVAMCGFLWSNWTEYKGTLGIEFGDYGIKQYRYAKDFYKYALEEMEKIS